YEGERANRRKVMHDRISGHDRSILDVYMSAEQHAIDQDGVVEHMAVMGDVTVRHQQIAVADPRAAVFLVSSPIDRDSFAELVAAADFNPRVAAVIGLVLRIAADDASRPKA